jgi:hypothetical protein
LIASATAKTTATINQITHASMSVI